MAIVFAIGAGLILGSFLSVVLERWDWKEGIVSGRSRCPNCMHKLAWYDLIPLFSWIALKGRCRYCRAPIPSAYPVLELTVAAVFGIAVWRYGVNIWSLTDLVLLFGLIALFFFDLRRRILPDVIVFSLIAIAMGQFVFLWPTLLTSGLIMGAVLVVVFGAIHYGSRGRLLGLGDVKLSFLIGLLFGYPGAIGVTLLAIWAGALFGLLLIVRKRASMKTALPFGSFWTATAILTLLWPAPALYLAGFFVL